MSRWRSVEVTEGGFLDRLPHGYRSPYIRAVIDRHLEELRRGLALLRKGRGQAEVEELIRAGDVPVSRRMETDVELLRATERAAVEDLWWMSEVSGLDADALIELLESGAGA